MTELHTIEVRYEDTDGRHVDVHDAADYSVYDDELCVYAGVCACCDRVEETHRYNDHSLVKFSTEPTEHEREDREAQFGELVPWWVPLLAMLTVVATVLLLSYLESTGGTVSL